MKKLSYWRWAVMGALILPLMVIGLMATVLLVGILLTPLFDLIVAAPGWVKGLLALAIFGGVLGALCCGFERGDIP